MIYVTLLYALFASVFTIAKVALENTQPLFLVGTRMIFAGFLLLCYEIYQGRFKFSLGKAIWKKLLLLALFNIYLTNAFEFWGLQYLTSFKTCFIYSLSPFLSALFSYILFNEKLNQKKWFGLIIGIGGFVPILLHYSNQESLAGELFFFSWAELAVIFAVISSCYGWILLKQIVKDGEISPFSANGWSMLLGGIVALIHSGISEQWTPIPVSNLQPFIWSTLLLVLISNLISYNLYGLLLKRYSATFLSFCGFITPLFTASFGWFFLGEEMNSSFYFSFFIVLLGLILFNQEELKEYRLRPQMVKS